MKIRNTMTRSLEDFVSIKDGQVRMYTCGPTVYNFAHIGNYRAYMFEDILRRYLEFSGYDVVQVMNLTDVDDKTIRGAIEQGLALNDYTKTYKDAFFNDLKTLNIEPAEYYPAATDHIPEMIELIERLFKLGYAYLSEDGSVYFDVAKFGDYGKLAHIDKAGLRPGARVVHDEYDKENIADFALWKGWDENDGDVAWDSPWGRGRPGWHIECSAMSIKYLGETFDIHTGGVDNMFPHHENEIAQAESSTGKRFVNYWMHCAHLRVNGQKMSKSLGNFFTLRDIQDKGYTGREIRYVLISAQYRQTLNFTFDALNAARSAIARIDEFQERLACLVDDSAVASSPAWLDDALTKFKEAMDDDLNVPEALASLFDIIRSGNKAIDKKDLDCNAAAAVVLALKRLDSVLGVIVREDENPPEEVLAVLERRKLARAEKNWAESDATRDIIAGMGWEVRDTAEGQTLRKLRNG